MAGALRFAGLQLGWLACVLGAAAGRPLTGVLVVLTFAAVALARSAARREVLVAIGSAVLIGLVADGGLTLGGFLVFPPQATRGWPVPIWMLALWANFALSLDAFSWFRARPVLAAAFGAVGGPLSYLAGARLGAVTLHPTEPVALAAVAVLWTFAMPLLLCALPAFAAPAASAGQARLAHTRGTGSS